MLFQSVALLSNQQLQRTNLFCNFFLLALCNETLFLFILQKVYSVSRKLIKMSFSYCMHNVFLINTSSPQHLPNYQKYLTLLLFNMVTFMINAIIRSYVYYLLKSVIYNLVIYQTSNNYLLLSLASQINFQKQSSGLSLLQSVRNPYGCCRLKNVN